MALPVVALLDELGEELVPVLVLELELVVGELDVVMLVVLVEVELVDVEVH